ncbi:similar to Saccharomyces cerevisiae YJL084C ALY2 Alpha arrestin that controls nutrient-mediated intracellular sorting of permease Gap1p [Maudiozyma barnettii]|uniref:Similar to Saccharomyces cerevisiae YJL084C ALY2 Alpha arrestin that controls nutrient-mediated intracellular sorting of permease Gap1p n=1 Tax=Maudiozyma barnettii TaxID=61262 RepID=A0A8H2VFE4_9SACH|nr:uncharacterized protein KABA2_04S09416 [Kazachstania barnettii]CAB4254576.1 similar to Saccharomyces cerevisiae YJL084C ALY2 Alpha arrestin that controls nutrient-mediated intracellular sorting of permease Gap1p [Kazachstania barnettii]CAD1782618.1 similar to Saccharomyces cerevisiae YJL084C ALY2 Alpha arrestin that controls nutrient-mediated intracellular sorting of permease Gap1p [Kazachstania barnettii]
MANINSPIVPIEKDINHILLNEKPVVTTSSLEAYIQLVEPVIFLRGFEVNNNNNNQRNDEDDDNTTPPCIMRGTVILRLLKPTKLKKIALSFNGDSRTDWPEGMANLALKDTGKVVLQDEFCENKKLIENNWPFFNYKNVNLLLKNEQSKTIKQTRLDKILRFSGASIYRPLNDCKTNNDITTDVGSSIINQDNLSDISPSTSIKNDKFLDIDKTNKLNKTKSLNGPYETNKSKETPSSQRRGSFFADLLISPFSHANTTANNNNNNTSTHLDNDNGAIEDDETDDFNSTGDMSSLFEKDTFVFPTGEYVFPFEQLIPHTLPESIKVEYGQVKYQLKLEIKRFSMFKSSFLLSKPIQLIRSPSDTSIEESEPIIISKAWKDRLKYDILINSKDVILDAFLPISIHLAPTDKICMYRTRIYITESIEYYGNKKSIHRVEKTKKHLLAEHNGPFNDPDNKNLDRENFRNYGNLLEEETTGDLIDKIFEYQVFVPKNFNGYKQLHPDTTNEDIIVNHWLKIAFRVSFVVDGKTKFFEVSIDSPIRVLHRLCSHANTLLPNYYSNIRMPNDEDDDAMNSSTVNNLYHNSNIFFPKELCTSPILDNDLDVFDLTIPSILQNDRLHPRGGSNKQKNNNENSTGKRLSFSLASLGSSKSAKNVSNIDDDNGRRHSIALINSPRMESNIYEPQALAKELAYPQAIPAFKSTVTIPIPRLEPPPPPYVKTRHHSVPQVFSKMSQLTESQETLIGNNLDMHINTGIHFKNPNPFKKPNSTKFVATDSSYSTAPDQPIVPNFTFSFSENNDKTHRRNSIAHEPRYNTNARNNNLLESPSNFPPNYEMSEASDQDDQNDLTMFNLDENAWYPHPLK